MRQKLFMAVNSIIDQGGISTSIQNLLNEIHGKYDVTLCSIQDYISPNVVLPQDVHVVRGSRMIGEAILNRDLLRLGLWGRLRMSITRWVRRKKGMQYIVDKSVGKIQVPEIEYDAAIAFSGDQFDSAGNLSVGGDYEFVKNQIKAKRKIAWMHNDLRKEGYNHDIALRVYRGFDAIVAVSGENKNLIAKVVPEYKDRIHVIYNTYNLTDIINRSKEGNPYEDSGKLHFVTVARLDLRQKCQNRIIEACGSLKKEGFANFDWYLVGGGEIETLKKMAEEHDVMDIIHFEGLRTNPYPYMLNADAFVLTSLYEGYGMTIKEAQILGCPTLVTNFGPAHEAVEDGKQGQICDNSTEGVYNMIKGVLQKPEILNEYRLYLKKHPVNNDLALNQFSDVCGLN